MTSPIKANTTPYSATTGNLDYYLGQPGALALLPSPNDAVSRPRQRNRSLVRLYNGGSTVLMQQYAKGQWTLSWDHLYNADADVIHAFADGAMGRGPFGLIDPTVRNMLTFEVASTGIRTSADIGWQANGGTVARSGAVSPQRFAGVLSWSGMDVGDVLTMQASYDLVPLRWMDLDSHAWQDDPYTWAGYPDNPQWSGDTSTVPFWVPGLPVSFSVSAKGSSTVNLTALCLDVNGNPVGTVLLATATLTAAWTRLTGTLSNTPAGTAFVLPSLAMAANPAVVSVCAAQGEYASTASLWQPGYGSPRVVLIADPDVSVPQFDYTSTAITLGHI